MWACQFPGCRSSPDQIAVLRTRRPDGFPHDEDTNLRVCTVCRRLPLRGGQALELAPEESLDDAFLAGIKEELASIEESEKNIQALSQVFRRLKWCLSDATDWGGEGRVQSEPASGFPSGVSRRELWTMGRPLRWRSPRAGRGGRGNAWSCAVCGAGLPRQGLRAPGVRAFLRVCTPGCP